MRKLLFFIVAVIGLAGCDFEPKVHYSPSFKDDPVKKRIELDEFKRKNPVLYRMKMEGIENMTEDEYLDSILKDWPFPGARGNWIPSRDGIENSDTVVDGFPYNRV